MSVCKPPMRAFQKLQTETVVFKTRTCDVCEKYQTSAKDFYKILGVSRAATNAEIKRAYKKLAVQYHPDKNPSEKAKDKFIEIQEAYETLSIEDARIEYDNLEQRGQQRGEVCVFTPTLKSSADGSKKIPKTAFLLQQDHGKRATSHSQGGTSGWEGLFKSDAGNIWEGLFGGSSPTRSTIPNLQNRRHFTSEVLQGDSVWLIQVCSSSIFCRFASVVWEDAARELKGVAKLGRVQTASDPELTAQLLAGGSVSGFPGPSQLDFPLVIGFPAECSEFSCGMRFLGASRSEELASFVVDSLMKLPQIPSVSKDTVERFVSKAAQHKVVMLAFSKGSHGSLLLHRVGAEYSDRILTGRVSHSPQEHEFWEERFGVRKVPAVVFLRGPGSLPVVLDARSGGKLNISALAAKYQWQLIPQLRQANAHALGCGWGSGINHTTQAQACAVLVGRHGQSLRGRLRMASLADHFSRTAGRGSATAASRAYAAGSLRLLWLDAGTHSSFCRYHLRHRGEEMVRSVCGSRRLAWLPLWGGREEPDLKLLAYKPGATQLSLWWRLPHRFAVFDGDILEASLLDTASWLDLFLENSLQETVESKKVPPDLEADHGWPIPDSWVSGYLRPLATKLEAWRDRQDGTSDVVVTLVSMLALSQGRWFRGPALLLLACYLIVRTDMLSPYSW